MNHWVSWMQTEMALNTMMTEYIALSTGMRALIILKRLAEEVCTHVGLEEDKISTIKAKTVVSEDKYGTLMLANLSLVAAHPPVNSFT
jgi:hypothetical protein